tara:strand:+ start:78 stop:359 length:282 start_codon:yes stop_codon:yes gene_type:complete
MRTIKRTSAFKRDFKREKKGRHQKTLEAELMAVITVIATDATLDDVHRDHALVGEWHDHRNCHIKPDLVLIYRTTDDHGLDLVRLGSHSELGL